MTKVKPKNMKERDESFVLMFRNFVFFDVTQYECSNGDLYVRNNVDGVILKRYFRMNANDQLTVFKNRSEFDEFMDKVKEEGYMFGPETSRPFILESYMPVRDSVTGDIVSIKSLWDGESFTYEDNPSYFDIVARVFVEERINENLGRKGGTL